MEKPQSDDNVTAICAKDNVSVKQAYQLCVEHPIGCDVPETGIFLPLIQPVCTGPMLQPNESCLGYKCIYS
jgi:hypothetical protein